MAIDVFSAPFHVFAGSRRTFLVLCDHASNAVPDEYSALGLAAPDLERHIGFDLGAHGVAQALASSLACPAIMGGTSRLLIDLNRSIDDASSIAAESDHTIIPGNTAIDPAGRNERVRKFHEPYHAHIDAYLDDLLASGIRPTVVSVHSFNPVLEGVSRPWPVAVLWKHQREAVAPLIDWLAADGHMVGDNHPYDARVLLGWTLEQHAVRRGLPHVLFEVRNNEIDTVETQREWGERLYRAIRETRFGLPTDAS